jgi:choline kinase
MNGETTLAITMAGFGTRFKAAGYTIPKYMIEARGVTSFDWSLKGLDTYIRMKAEFIFIVRGADKATSFITARAYALGIDRFRIVELAAPTDGQATTARLACDGASSGGPFAIFNIDTAIRPGALRPADAKGDGWIPCFRAPGEGWSFVRVNETGKAVEIREKKRISDYATIGFYWFRSVRQYCDTYDAYYGTPGREERGERYVAPLYNHLIDVGECVTVTEIPFEDVAPLGTPEELATFHPRWVAAE